MELKKTKKDTTVIWDEYMRGKSYCSSRNMYVEGKENWDYFFGRQWEDLEKPPINSPAYTEPVVINIIAAILKYKYNTVNANNYQIVFNPNSYDTPEQLEQLRTVAKGLTQFINKLWEKAQAGRIVRRVVKSAAVNSEGIVYLFVEDDKLTVEEIDKNNIYFGNENNSNIQEQPYILVTFRKPVEEVRRLARKYREEKRNHLTDAEINSIFKDSETFEQQGRDKMAMEITDMCLMIMKFYKKEDGIIYVQAATETEMIIEESSTDCKLYPIAHFVWEEEKDSARGVSEVHKHKPNQREINKNETRRLIATKVAAFPKIVVDEEVVSNPEALEGVGSTIRLTNVRANAVSNVIDYLRPATMSPDAANVQSELISYTRELAGAGENATGEIDPTQASGKAILAVQQAQQQPLTEQTESYKYFLEDIAKILFELVKVYFLDGITLYSKEESFDQLGQSQIFNKPFKITKEELQALDFDMKIDISKTGAFDKMVQEIFLQEMLTSGLITLEEYTEALADDSSSPKAELSLICTNRRERKRRIAEIQKQVNAYASAMKQEIISKGGDPDEMFAMQDSGNASVGSQGQFDTAQM